MSTIGSPYGKLLSDTGFDVLKMGLCETEPFTAVVVVSITSILDLVKLQKSEFKSRSNLL